MEECFSGAQIGLLRNPDTRWVGTRRSKNRNTHSICIELNGGWPKPFYLHPGHFPGTLALLFSPQSRMTGYRNWRAMQDMRRYRHHYPVGTHSPCLETQPASQIRVSPGLLKIWLWVLWFVLHGMEGKPISSLSFRSMPCPWLEGDRARCAAQALEPSVKMRE